MRAVRETLLDCLRRRDIRRVSSRVEAIVRARDIGRLDTLPALEQIRDYCPDHNEGWGKFRVPKRRRVEMATGMDDESTMTRRWAR